MEPISVGHKSSRKREQEIRKRVAERLRILLLEAGEVEAGLIGMTAT